MTADIEPLWVAPKLLCILMDPRDGATHLLCHRAKIASGLLDRNEIDRDVMRTCVDEHLGWIAVILRCPAEPRATVDENENRCVLSLGAIDVECLNCR